MPIILEKPFNPGDQDPDKTYGEVKITRLVVNLDAAQFEVACQYGNTVDGKWVPGVIGPKVHTIRDVPARVQPSFVEIDANTGEPFTVPERVLQEAQPHYSKLVTSKPASGETTYQAAARGLYEWFIEQEIYAGKLA